MKFYKKIIEKISPIYKQNLSKKCTTQVVYVNTKNIS